MLQYIISQQAGGKRKSASEIKNILWVQMNLSFVQFCTFPDMRKLNNMSAAYSSLLGCVIYVAPISWPLIYKKGGLWLVKIKKQKNVRNVGGYFH